MALQDILKEVEERSAAERSSMQDEHEATKKALLSETDHEISRIEEEYRKKISDDTSAYERREKDLMELEAKRIVDGKKNDLISAEARKASAIIRNADTGFRNEELLQLMLSAGEKKLGKNLTVRCSPANAAFFKGKAKNVEADLGESEKGIICISSDGKKVLNLTMDFILRDILEDILDGISRKARVV